MGDRTPIAWTHYTFNLVWGCAKLSPGCKHCYAEERTTRFDGPRYWGPGKPRKTLSAQYWKAPLKWNLDAQEASERRRVFCGSMCDVFEDHETVTQERAKLWPLIRQTPALDWLLLTKRADRIAEHLPADWPLPNVWLGVSIENEDSLWRADALRVIRAVVRFVSYEPALGPLAHVLDLEGLDWVIYGGESGPNFRPDKDEWARDMRAKCRANGTAFFYKQTAARRQGTRPVLDGKTVQEYPVPRWCHRERMPDVREL